MIPQPAPFVIEPADWAQERFEREAAERAQAEQERNRLREELRAELENTQTEEPG